MLEILYRAGGTVGAERSRDLTTAALTSSRHASALLIVERQLLLRGDVTGDDVVDDEPARKRVKSCDHDDEEYWSQLVRSVHGQWLQLLGRSKFAQKIKG